MSVAGVPQWLSRSIPHQNRWCNSSCQRAWHWRGEHLFHTPVVLLLQSNSVSTHVVVIQSAIHWHLWADVCPSTRCMWAHWPFCPRRHPHPVHITWNVHPCSVDTPVDVHGRSHSFLFIHPREVFLAWCWVMARPFSSCCIVLLSLPPGVCSTGVGLDTSVLYLADTCTCKGMPPSDAMRRNSVLM